MAVTVTAVTPPTNLVATLQVGGSLAANTTYYVVGFAYESKYRTPLTTTYLDRLGCHSELSQEVSFTTTDTHKSVMLNWTNGGAGAHYGFLLSTIAGDYRNTNAYGHADHIYYMAEYVLDGGVGYTITAVSSSIKVVHSAQLNNDIVFGLSKNAAVIKCYLSGSETLDLGDVYQAVIDAGYGSSVHYDGYNFALKGFLIADSEDDGELVVERKNIVFFKGGVKHQSNSYVIRFGRWLSDVAGADYIYGNKIDIQNVHQPFSSSVGDLFHLYGNSIMSGSSRLALLDETLYDSYYNGAGAYLSSQVQEIRDNMLGVSLRNITSPVYDLKFKQLNNYSNYRYVRCTMLAIVRMPYRQGGLFYDCKWLTFPVAFQVYNAGGFATSGYYSDLYDNVFDGYPDGMLDYPYVNFRSSSVPTSNQFLRVHYSINLSIQGKDGTPMSGVIVSAYDCDGNPAVWQENDGTDDRLSNGVTHNESVVTDANGEIDYYLESYKIEVHPDNTDTGDIYNVLKTNKYPYTLVFHREGFKESSITITKLNKKVEGRVVIEPYEVPVNVYIDEHLPSFNIIPQSIPMQLSASQEAPLQLKAQSVPMQLRAQSSEPISIKSTPKLTLK